VEGVGQLTNESLPLHSWDVPTPLRLDRHYDHAPITEAIIELSCVLPTDVTLEDLTHVVDRQVFTSEGQAVLISGRIEVGPNGIKGDTSGEQIGHLYRRNDGLRVIQSRLNGFAYSVLAPYDRWETFSAEAWEHWQVYKDIARPTKVSRLGVRFINKIDIPQASIEIKDYLRTAVDVSPYLPQVTASYFLQVVVPLLTFDASATITSTVLPPSSSDATSLILDIDTWRLLDVSVDDDAESGRLQEALNDLRAAKNFVFEACITDATRGLIS
jgi:uncharacterized protein (TIGR04255 family)